jgi:hypothetical protein
MKKERIENQRGARTKQVFKRERKRERKHTFLKREMPRPEVFDDVAD